MYSRRSFSETKACLKPSSAPRERYYNSDGGGSSTSSHPSNSSANSLLQPRIESHSSLVHHFGKSIPEEYPFKQPILRATESKPAFQARLTRAANNFNLSLDVIAEVNAMKADMNQTDWDVLFLFVPLSFFPFPPFFLYLFLSFSSYRISYLI